MPGKAEKQQEEESTIFWLWTDETPTYTTTQFRFTNVKWHSSERGATRLAVFCNLAVGKILILPCILLLEEMA